MAAASRPKPQNGRHYGLRNRQWWGWQKYVVPTSIFWPWLLEQKPHILATMEPLQRSGNGAIQAGNQYDNEQGWKEMLSHRMALLLNNSPEAVLRRLWGASAGEAKAISAEYVDAACLAMGLYLDRDVDLPVLPGSVNVAKELLLERVSDQSISLDELELRRLAKTTVRISALICSYPHHTERLLDMAPFDCLRPPK